MITLSVDGDVVARKRVERTIVQTAGLGETFDIGLDRGVPVTSELAGDGAFAGDIDIVTVALGPVGRKRPPTQVRLRRRNTSRGGPSPRSSRAAASRRCP